MYNQDQEIIEEIGRTISEGYHTVYGDVYVCGNAHVKVYGIAGETAMVVVVDKAIVEAFSGVHVHVDTFAVVKIHRGATVTEHSQGEIRHAPCLSGRLCNCTRAEGF